VPVRVNILHCHDDFETQEISDIMVCLTSYILCKGDTGSENEFYLGVTSRAESIHLNLCAPWYAHLT